MSDKMNAFPNTGMNKQHAGSQTDKPQTDLDSAWKDVIDQLFEPFTGFFFPNIHRDIDFSNGIEIPDSKSTGISPYGNVGKRYADELVKVHLKDGSQACVCVFIHIEAQGSRETKGIFPQRAYIYNYRPDEYLVQQWDFELRMKIPMVKIIDFKNNQELRKMLETSDNPMAMVVKAQLKSYELKKPMIKKSLRSNGNLSVSVMKEGTQRKRFVPL